MSELGVLRFGFKGGDLGAGEGYGVQGGRARRLRIASSCLSIRDVLIRHLTVAASCGVMEVSLSFFIVSSEKALKQKSGKGWRIRDPGRVRYVWKERSDPVMELGCFSTIHDRLWQSLPPFMPLVSPPHKVLVSYGDRYRFIVEALSFLFLGEASVEG